MTLPFDPERYSHRLAPLGAFLIVIAVAFSQLWSIPLALVGFALLAISCWSERDGFLFFGPFVRMELVTAVRRSRIHLFRTLLVAVVGIAFCIAAYSRHNPSNVDTLQKAGSILILAAAYLIAFVVLPFGIAAVANSISGERENLRLDFLLITDLRNREIVIGRSFGRSMQSFMLLLAVMPFAVVIPNFFGLPTTLASIPMAYAILTFLSMFGFILYNSTTSPSTKRGNPRASLIATTFMLTTFGTGMLSLIPNIWSTLFTVPGIGTVEVGDVLEYIAIANPIMAISLVIQGYTGGLDPLEVSGKWLPIYAMYHLGIFFFCTLKSIQVLRTASADLAGQAPAGVMNDGKRFTDKPVVSERPVLWKEIHFQDLIPKTKAAKRSKFIISAILGYIPSIFILIVGLTHWQRMSDYVSIILKGAFPVISWIVTVIGLRFAAGTISRERERNTLTSLVTTPIPLREILFHKWIGVFLSHRGEIIWMLLLGVPAILTGLYPAWVFIGVLFLTVSFQCVGISYGILASVSWAKWEKAVKSAFFRGFIMCCFQLAFALIPIALVLTKILPQAKYAIIVAFPFSSLIAIANYKECLPDEIPYWFGAGILAAIHMLTIAFLVYRRAVKNFERMSREGTVDMGTPS